MKKAFLKNFATFTGKLMCLSLFLNIGVYLWICVALKAPVLKNIWERLLLNGRYWYTNYEILLSLTIEIKWKFMHFHSANFFRVPLRKKCPYSELFWFRFFLLFHAFGLNMEKYGVSLHIQSKCGKMWEKCGPE